MPPKPNYTGALDLIAAMNAEAGAPCPSTRAYKQRLRRARTDAAKAKIVNDYLTDSADAMARGLNRRRPPSSN